MKNQYFGDISDYRKFGLLRVLSGNGQTGVGVCWMLTQDDTSTDGQFRKYLQEPAKWEHYDQELFGCLCNCRRKVNDAEKLNLLPSARYWTELLEDNAKSRAEYFRGMERALAGVDLVFFDPDNGFEVRSRPQGTKHSSKYLYWSELERCFARGCSVLVYQHFCREKRGPFIERIAKDIHDCTQASPIYSFRTPRVVFFLAAQPRHNAHFAQKAGGVRSWHPEITLKRHAF